MCVSSGNKCTRGNRRVPSRRGHYPFNELLCFCTCFWLFVNIDQANTMWSMLGTVFGAKVTGNVMTWYCASCNLLLPWKHTKILLFSILVFFSSRFFSFFKFIYALMVLVLPLLNIFEMRTFILAMKFTGITGLFIPYRFPFASRHTRHIDFHWYAPHNLVFYQKNGR